MSIRSLLFVSALLVPGVSVGTAASPEENVIVTGKVTDRNGDPITKCEVFFNRETWITDESIRAECDASGTYLIAVPKGHYNSVYICDEDKYGKTALEFWGWNLDIEEDRVLDVTFDKLEVYSLAVWNSNGGSDTVFASFRPMSVEKLQNPAVYPIDELGRDATVFDITPSLEMSGVTAEIDSAPVAVKSLQWIYEKQNKCDGGRSGSCYMRVAIIQLERPVLMEGTHLVRIKITDHETAAIGEAVTEFSSNRVGYGF